MTPTKERFLREADVSILLTSEEHRKVCSQTVGDRAFGMLTTYSLKALVEADR